MFLYVGQTDNLLQRILEHTLKIGGGRSSRSNVRGRSFRMGVVNSSLIWW